jgi:thiol-disulfide isomerase/thioredoxin
MSMVLKLLGVMAVFCVGIVIVMNLLPHETGPNSPPREGAMAEFKPRSPSTPAPAVEFFDADNGKLDFSAFKGKVALINLWATWCLPCVKEMPSLEKLKQTHENDDFVVVTISEDRQGTKLVDEFFQKNGLKTLPRYVDPQSRIGRALKLNGLPTTVLLDPEGRELGRFEGSADWAGADALKLIDWYIAHTKTAQ